jgi:hypothetical protein
MSKDRHKLKPSALPKGVRKGPPENMTSEIHLKKRNSYLPVSKAGEEVPRERQSLVWSCAVSLQVWLFRPLSF